MKSICLVLVLAVAVNAIDLSLNWDALRVTWGFRPLWALDKLPRSLDENSEHFDMRDDLCAAQGKFVGKRFWYKQDPAMTLLFDKNGIIAGIQTSLKKTDYTPKGSMAPLFIDDGDFWTLSAYFVDPSTVCTQGRTKDDLTKQGTGTGLWLQIGPDAIQNNVNIPLKEDDIKKTKWGHGKCFKTMGQHYWFNISKEMDCNDIAPNCLLYNKGQLTGFCFAPNANPSSDRYDWPAPTIGVLDKFLDPVPDCMHKDPSFAKQSTLHIFFTGSPELTSWC